MPRDKGVEALACAGAIFNQLADRRSEPTFTLATIFGVLEGLTTELGGDWIAASARAASALATAEKAGD